ncbi:MAG TPA: glycosyltransferase family 4 protein [Phycisphaerae bacterium]|nr:glycosyltransferase family 4 protein [Phycisphaerae bacterium]
MRILFYDPNHADYHVGSVFERPLGGTQSAACYLAMELARRGHEVAYLTGAAGNQTIAGVECLGRGFLRGPAIARLDADVLIVVQRAGAAPALRGLLPEKTRLVFWSADTPNQSVLGPLHDPREQAALDAVVTVSDWQRRQFAAAFPGVAGKLAVVRYGMAPAFQALYPPAAPVLPDKPWPPVLAYTSTPFRGLSVLISIFPEIRRRVPGARLRVFSGLQVYFVDRLAESADARALYDACRKTDGIDYIGNLPQPELAGHMRGISMLCYPNTYEETACISAMEAMAAGCSIVTSSLGALPETCAGRARLVDRTGSMEEFARHFIEATVEEAQRQRNEPDAEEARRREHVDYARRTFDWSLRAAEWEMFLLGLAAGRGPAEF